MVVMVRPAEPADAEQVVRVRVRSWQDAYPGIVPDDVLAALDDQLPAQVEQARAALVVNRAPPLPDPGGDRRR